MWWLAICVCESQHRQNYCFWGQMCVLACRLEVKWSQDKSIISKGFTCFVCVLMMWSDWGWSLEENANFYFSWGTKNWFLALSGRKNSLVQMFCESCVQLDIIHPSIHPHDSEICDSRLSYLKFMFLLTSSNSYKIIKIQHSYMTYIAS